MHPKSKLYAIVRWTGLIIGPLAAIIVYWALPTEYLRQDGLPVPLTPAGRATMAVMVWMAIWWLTEAINVSATALVPLVAFPALGIATMREAAAPYAHPLIFLFFGGFILALSMQTLGARSQDCIVNVELRGDAADIHGGPASCSSQRFSARLFPTPRRPR